MHTIKNIIIIIFCTTLSGCHIYRAYQRPDSVTVSDSLYRQPVAAEDTVSLASLSWKELFTDPQLQQLIETGLNHNTDLNIARLKVKEAEALLMTSRLSYLPRYLLPHKEHYPAPTEVKPPRLTTLQYLPIGKSTCSVNY